MLLSGILALVALGIDYILLWMAKQLFENPPFILEAMEVYLPFEVIVIFVVSLIGFLVIMWRQQKKEGLKQ
jgi:hypothetical protein